MPRFSVKCDSTPEWRGDMDGGWEELKKQGSVAGNGWAISAYFNGFLVLSAVAQ